MRTARLRASFGSHTVWLAHSASPLKSARLAQLGIAVRRPHALAGKARCEPIRAPLPPSDRLPRLFREAQGKRFAGDGLVLRSRCSRVWVVLDPIGSAAAQGLHRVARAIGTDPGYVALPEGGDLSPQPGVWHPSAPHPEATPVLRAALICSGGWMRSFVGSRQSRKSH